MKPTIFVIFGISGDLARTKLVPALQHLHADGQLPDQFHIFGVSRRDWDTETYMAHINSALGNNTDQIFLKHNSYIRGNFDDTALYAHIAETLQKCDADFGVCANKLFYLAVPPGLYEGILEHISSSGLSIPCNDAQGWTRILIEKPFGSDLETARSLDVRLGKLFKEEQIFRIDHYLAKETIQNILAFRFSNSLFEPLWNKKHVSSVHISLYEKNTVGSRGAFYDETGALKDVGQNHLLQMLALVAMEKPESPLPEFVRTERAKVLRYLKVPSKRDMLRGQYIGYKEESGVNKDSDTETFFSVRTGITNRRWRGVPFYLTSGKALNDSYVDIDVYFKDDPFTSFLPAQFEKQEQNRITFRVQPREGISILFWSKVPGFEHKIEPKELSFEYGSGGRKIDAYEKVLRDCIAGDQMLFASTDEVRAEWDFIEKIRARWIDIPMLEYRIGSEGPEECKTFLKT